MIPIFLFNLASRQLQHLATRQSVISGNIANANTPGYRAQDVTPFREVLNKTGLQVAATNAAHLEGGFSAERALKGKASAAGETVHSGNSVGIEEQMMKAGEIARDQSLNVGVVKAFHRMLLASVRSGS
ncbi:flagellar basal body rod protein FlgB [Methylobacterium sp. 1030]|uniref:flagellar basal body rod protein FlgB n=1 Tax=Methylobacterium sp. 1030 TaxID=3156404 RepID=UPI00339AD8F7